MEEKDFTVGIVLAGGKGSRMGTKLEKQYLKLKGRPVLYYSLMAFEQSIVDEVILVVGEGQEQFCRKNIIEKYGLTKVHTMVQGGKERYDSVYAGLVHAQNCQIVLIHDGARPFIDADLIDRLIEETIREEACVTAVRSKDTIRISDCSEYAMETPERNSVWNIQTPQSFHYDLIRNAYDRFYEEIRKNPEKEIRITDDAMILEQYGNRKVKLFEGSYKNIKITTPEDLDMGEVFLRTKSFEK